MGELERLLQNFLQDEKLEKKELSVIYHYFKVKAEEVEYTDEKLQLFATELNEIFKLGLDLEALFSDPLTVWQKLKSQLKNFTEVKYSVAKFVVLHFVITHEQSQALKAQNKLLKKIVEEKIKLEI